MQATAKAPPSEAREQETPGGGVPSTTMFFYLCRGHSFTQYTGAVCHQLAIHWGNGFKRARPVGHAYQLTNELGSASQALRPLSALGATNNLIRRRVIRSRPLLEKDAYALTHSSHIKTMVPFALQHCRSQAGALVKDRYIAAVFDRQTHTREVMVTIASVDITSKSKEDPEHKSRCLTHCIVCI